MSNDARHWAWSIPDLPTPFRLLLVALAEHVRDGVTCFPGQARLAAMCSVSERQVRNLLRELQVRGLITVEHRPGQGSGRKSNLYRLAMIDRRPDPDCPEGYLEASLRNHDSGCDEASGNPVPGNRNSGAGNRNSASAESKERILRKKLRDTPPNPPKGGHFGHPRDDFSPSPEKAAPEGTPAEKGNRSASAGKRVRGSFPREGTGSPLEGQGSSRGSYTRRGKRNEAHERLAEKDYTVGATRDEDLPDWARVWRDRANDAQ
jgi:hypothetical protein